MAKQSAASLTFPPGRRPVNKSTIAMRSQGTTLPLQSYQSTFETFQDPAIFVTCNEIREKSQIMDFLLPEMLIDKQ